MSLEKPGVVERRAGLVVTHHQPGVVTVGQGDGVHRAELADFGEEREGVVPVVGAPRAERRLDLRAWLTVCRESDRRRYSSWTNPEHRIRSHEILSFSVLRYACCSMMKSPSGSFAWNR